MAAVVAFNAVMLRPELRAVEFPNDMGMHVSMSKWAADAIGKGRVPFDGWYPYLGLGSPQPSQYPTLAHSITGFIGQVFDVTTTARVLWFLLLVTWPIAVYIGARLAGFGQRPAACAAALSWFSSSITGYGAELSSYVWRGYGIYPQLFAQWALPIAWALTWRALAGRRRLWPASLAVGITIALHFVTGYVCAIGVGGIALGVAVSRPTWRERWITMVRGLAVLAGAAAAIAYVIVPLLMHSKYALFPGVDRTTVGGLGLAGYTPIKAAGWLLSGQLYDHRRLPVMTILVFLGVIACIRHRSPAGAGVLGLWVTNTLVFAFGYKLGPLKAVLPGSSDLFTRFDIGVHVSGVLLAGIGAAWVLGPVGRWVRSVQPRPVLGGAAVAALFIAFTAPSWHASWQYLAQENGYISLQLGTYEPAVGQNIAKLVAIGQANGPGRFFSGYTSSWGPKFRDGYTPVYMWYSNHSVDAVGYATRVASLSSEVEQAFFEVVPGVFPLYGVRYIIAPADHPPAAGVPVRVLASAGPATLYEVTSTTGYFAVADTVGTITADRRTLAGKVAPLIASAQAAPTVFPTIALNGQPAEPPTQTSPPANPPGSVVYEDDAPADGRFAATVNTSRTAAIILRSSYAGSCTWILSGCRSTWDVKVDGKPARAYPIAPSFVAVTVPAGQHGVEFRYKPYRHYLALFAFGALFLVGMTALERRLSRRVARSD